MARSVLFSERQAEVIKNTPLFVKDPKMWSLPDTFEGKNVSDLVMTVMAACVTQLLQASKPCSSSPRGQEGLVIQGWKSRFRV